MRQSSSGSRFDLHLSPENKAAFQAAFMTVLQLAHQLRLTRVGSVIRERADPDTAPA